MKKSTTIISLTVISLLAIGVSLAGVFAKRSEPISKGYAETHKIVLNGSHNNITLDRSDNPATLTVKTNEGTDLEFVYDNMSHNAGQFGVFNFGAVLRNVDPIFGLQSISLISTDYSNSLTIRYGYETAYEYQAEVEETDIFDFDGRNPKYFEITNEYSNPVEMISIEISFDCVSETSLNVQFTYDENSSCVVASPTSDDIASIIVPDYYKDDTYGIQPVELLTGVQSLYNLTSVTLGQFVNHYCEGYGDYSYDELSFIDCPNLATIIVDKDNSRYESLDNCVLYDPYNGWLCRVAPLYDSSIYDVPEYTQEILNLAFQDCVNITSINIPDSVAAIGEETFDGAWYLESINIDPNNSEYENYNDDGVVYSKGITDLIRYPMMAPVAYTVPDSVSEIKAGCFINTQIETINIGTNVTIIEDLAFQIGDGTGATLIINYAGSQEDWESLVGDATLSYDRVLDMHFNETW